MQTFLVRHALILPNGGLVVASHNEIRDNIIHLTKQYFSPTWIRGEPLIHVGRSIYEEEVHQVGIIPEMRGNMSIWGLWEIQIEAIIYVMFVDSELETWNPFLMDKLLAVQ